MSMTDPLGDLLTRIRNAQMRKKNKVSSPTSRLTVSSRLSPGSTNPASTECMPGGHCFCRPRRIRPSCSMRMMTAGSVRG